MEMHVLYPFMKNIDHILDLKGSTVTNGFRIFCFGLLYGWKGDATLFIL